MMETDTPEILREMIMSVKKVQELGIGLKLCCTEWTDWHRWGLLHECQSISHWDVHGKGPSCNPHFDVLTFQQGLTMSAGQTPCQRYWKQLLEYIRKGDFDPSFVITHRAYLAEGDR